MAISLSTLLLLGFVSVASALVGAALALLGAWIWYTARLVGRIASRGSLYLADFDNEQARKMNAAADVATGMAYMRQALRNISPEAAAEFYQDKPEPPAKPKKNKGTSI